MIKPDDIVDIQLDDVVQDSLSATESFISDRIQPAGERLLNLALENTIRDNPDFRDDLMRAVRLNPDNPNAAMAQMSIKNAAGDFWDRAGGRAYKGATDWVPGMGAEGNISAAARLAASGPFAAAAKAASKKRSAKAVAKPKKSKDS